MTGPINAESINSEPVKYCSASHQISSDGKRCRRRGINKSDLWRYATYTGIAVVALIGIALLFKLLLPGAFSFAAHGMSHILHPFGNNDIANLLFGATACVITAALLTAYLFRNKKFDDYSLDLLERLKKKDVQPLKHQSSAALKKIADKMTLLVQKSPQLHNTQFRMYATGKKIELRFFDAKGIPDLDAKAFHTIPLPIEQQGIELTKINNF